MKKIFLFCILIPNIFLFLFFSITQSFPLVAILLHSSSVVLLIGWAINIKRIPIFVRCHWIDIAVILSLFILALTLYVYKIDVITPGIQSDELTIAKAGEQMLLSSKLVPFVTINNGHATPLLYLEGISIAILGRTILAIRATSILFGALSVAAFYVLLRLFFKKIVSGLTSLMLLFCYPFVVVARLAYEITPEIFFQILTVIFFYKAWKTKDIRYYILTGLVLGAGLYTYVGFRTFTLIILGILSLYVIKISKDRKKILHGFVLFLIAFFIVSIPLLSYSLGHLNTVMARTTSLSLFGKNLPVLEIIKEVQGSTGRLSHLFFLVGDANNQPNGDPNFKQNPSNVNMFDFITFVLLLMGGGFLFKKNRPLFMLVLILSISPIVNDIFSLERIPEGHYYGLGHPNTLRIAGIIPIIYFLVAYGLSSVRIFLKKTPALYPSLLSLVMMLIVGINWYVYYNQPDNQWYSIYTYVENGVKVLRVADVMNKTTAQKIYISPSFLADERLKYFVKTPVDFIAYTPKTTTQILSDANSTKLLVFDPDFNPRLGKAFFEAVKAKPALLHGTILTSPDNKVDAFILGQ